MKKAALVNHKVLVAFVLFLLAVTLFAYFVSALQEISTVTLNSTSGNNITSETLIATVSPLNASQSYLYEWYKDGSSAFTILDINTIPSSFTTAGEVWFVNATPKTLTNNYNVSAASFVQNFSVSAQDGLPDGIAFNNDGSKMFVSGISSSAVHEYSLSSGFNVSTASFVQNFSVSSETTTLRGLRFNNDGTKMFIIDTAGDIVYEYSLSSGFNVSTASLVQNFSVSSQHSAPEGLVFNNDGTKMFVTGGGSSNVSEYALTTGFNISTASFVQSLSVSAQDTTPTDVFFKSDGTTMFVLGYTDDIVYQYALTTGFNISTASVVGNFSISAQDTNPTGLTFKPDGTKMFMVGFVSDAVHEYDVGSVEAGTTVQSNSLTILNSIRITNVTLNATSINNLTTDNLTANVIGLAPANASVQYDWYKNGTLSAVFLGNATSQNTLPSNFTTAGDVWYVNATPKVFTNNFNVSAASFVQNFSVSAQDGLPDGIAFNNDGSKMFVSGISSSAVSEYSLTFGFDISTASFVQNFSVSSETTTLRGLRFNNDGTKMFIIDTTNADIYEYSLSSGFNVSTASLVQNFSVSAQGTFPEGLVFNNDGTKMFVTGGGSSNVSEYALTTGFNISTASFVQSLSVSAQDPTPTDVFFNSDGTTMFMLGFATDHVYQYALTTGFNISTASVVGNFSISAQDTDPTGLTFKPDGTKMFMVGFVNDQVYEYDVGVESGTSVQSNSLTILAIGVSFIDPTPANGTSINVNNTLINVSISGSLDQAIFNWNGTNYTCYNNLTCGGTSDTVLTLTNSSSTDWNLLVNKTNLTGGATYTYFAFANETGGETAQTETRTLIIDTLVPVAALVSPANGTLFSSSSNITFTCNATNTALANITLYHNISGSFIANQTNNVSGTFNETNFTINNVTDGTHTWNCLAVDQASNSAFAPSNFSFTVGGDVINPSVFDLIPISNSTFNVSDIIQISVNATDNVLVDTVLANITLPNGTVNQLTLANVSAITGTNADKFNVSFTIPNLAGTYNIVFIANDTSNNVNSTETTFFVGNNQPPSISSVVLNSTLGTNLTSENLTAYAINVTDPENDSVKVIYDWKKNGSSIAILNMPFEGGSNSTFTKDYSDSSNNGNVFGATYNAAGGYDGKGVYEFDGADDTINLGSSSSLALRENFTVMAWVNGGLFFNFPIIFCKGAINTEYLLFRDTNNNNFIFRVMNSTGDTANGNGSTVPLTNTWYHVAGRYNGTHVSVFVNGVEEGTSGAMTGLVSTSDSDLHIGTCEGTNFEWNGKIDESKIFNRSLSDEQIFAIYENRTDLIVSSETNVGEVWSVDVTPNDGSSDGTTVQSNNLTILADTILPAVFNLAPIANSTFNVSDSIEISANVTDNGIVDTVLANITFPNSTVQQLTLNNSLGDAKYNNSFTIPALLGQYNITFIANDTSNNINVSETTFFVSVDLIPPSVINVTPINGSIFNVSNVIQITANVTDNVEVNTVQANVTLPNSSIEQVTLLRDQVTDTYNNSFIIPAVSGRYNVTIFANDTSNTINASETTYFTVQEFITPNVTNLVPVRNTTYNVSTSIEIGANVTDNIAVDAVSINITLPNSSIQQFTLNNSAGDSFYNISYIIPAVIGQYNITFIANDTSNNINASETTFFVGIDLVLPSVFDLIPLANTSFNVSDIIEIAANVTDNVEVDTVLVNVTLPNSTTQQLTLTNTSGNKYNSTFTIPALLGQYNVTFIANDTSNNINQSETTFFVSVDTVPPLIANFTCVPNPAAINSTITCNATVTDNLAVSTVYANVTLPNSSIVNTTLSINNSNYEFIFNTTSETGIYTVVWNATDVNSNTIGATTTFEIMQPIIIVLGCTPNPANLTQEVACLANITTGTSQPVDTVLANITLPNQTVLVQTVLNTSSIYNFTFNVTSLIGFYNVTWFANDTLGTTSTKNDSFAVIDVTNPAVTALLPLANSTFEVGINIEVGANATDNIAVDTVLANITFPNSTIQQLTLVNATNKKYNNSFTIPALVGQYNVTFIANDTSNNFNASETTFFVSADTAAPSVINLTPISGSQFNISDVIAIAANVTDNWAIDAVKANITLPNGTIQQLTLNNTLGDIYNSSFTIPKVIGRYNITLIANDTNSNINASETTFFIANDTVKPTIISTSTTPGVVINGSSVNLSATASDNVQVDTIWANVTLPDNTSQLVMNLPASFTNTAQVGTYNVTFYANDTSGNTVNATDTFTTALPINITINVNVTVDVSANVSATVVATIRDSTTKETLSSIQVNGSESILLPNVPVDLEFNTTFNDTNLITTLFEFNLTENINGSIEFSNPSLDEFLITYAVNTTFNFNSAQVSVSYANVTFTNEDNLQLHKCDDFIVSAGTCSSVFNDVTNDAVTTHDKANDRFLYNTTSFSGFGIKEVTPSVTTTTTTTTSGGGGGGGGGSCAPGTTLVDGSCIAIEEPKPAPEEEPEEVPVEEVKQPTEEIPPAQIQPITGAVVAEPTRPVIPLGTGIALAIVVFILSGVILMRQKFFITIYRKHKHAKAAEHKKQHEPKEEVIDELRKVYK